MIRIAITAAYHAIYSTLPEDASVARMIVEGSAMPHPHRGGRRRPLGAVRRPSESYSDFLIFWEFPRLCRGGSSSLTFPTVAAERGWI